MLTVDQRPEKITPRHNGLHHDFLLEDSNGVGLEEDFHSHGIPPLVLPESPLLNLPSQVYQGLERIREITQGLSKNISKGIHSNNRAKGIDSSEEVAVPLLDLMARGEWIPKYAATLGFSEDGKTILHEFDTKETPHMLIVGGPDAGKTVMLRTIAASLALNNRQSEIQLAAICPITGDEERQRNQASSWYSLNYLPHMLCDIAFKHSDIVDLLTFLSNEVSYREKHDFKHPRMIVLIDQVDTLISHGGRPCAEPILRLAQKGDQIGIHLALSARSLDSAALSTQLLKELPTRLIGRPATRQNGPDNQLIREGDFDQLLGEGDFLHQQGGRAIRMQGAFISDHDLIPKIIEMNRKRAILLASPVQSRVRLEEPVNKPSDQPKPGSIINETIPFGFN